MANTYKAIATVTVGSGGAATIDFTSIPATYTDLVIKCSLKTDRTSDSVDVAMLSINGNTSNGSWRELFGSGSTAGSQSGTSSMRGAYTSTNTTPGQINVFGNGEIYFPNYLSNANKSYSSDAVTENNDTSAYIGLTAGLWSNTAAITSITLSVLVGTKFLQYSTATLYGIKNS